MPLAATNMTSYPASLQAPTWGEEVTENCDCSELVCLMVGSPFANMSDFLHNI